MKSIYKKYIISLVILFLYFLLRIKITHVIANTDFWDIPYYLLSLVILGIVLNVGFGFVLGLNIFIEEKRKEGKWMFNTNQALIIGVPILILSLSEIFRYIPLNRMPSTYREIQLNIVQSLELNFTSLQLVQVMLGFTIINSFRKECVYNE